MYLYCFFGIRKLLTHILGTCLDVHVWRERRSTTDTYSFEDTKGVMKIRKSKNRQHNSQKKKDKNTNNDLQNIQIKLKIYKTYK